MIASAEGADRWDAEGVREDMKLEREEDAERAWEAHMDSDDGLRPQKTGSVSKIILNVV